MGDSMAEMKSHQPQVNKPDKKPERSVDEVSPQESVAFYHALNVGQLGTAPHLVMQLQRLVGNRTIQRCFLPNPSPRQHQSIQRAIIPAGQLVNGTNYYFIYQTIFYKAKFNGTNQQNFQFTTDDDENISIPVAQPPPFHDDPEQLRAGEIGRVEGLIHQHTTHSGNIPELTLERQAIYIAVKTGDIPALINQLQQTQISCREGALILALMSCHKTSKVMTFVDKLLNEGSGHNSLGFEPLETFLRNAMGDVQPYQAPPRVGAFIHIFGTTHTVLYAGNNQVVSLNNGGQFTTGTLANEIAVLLNSPADTIREMLKLWYQGGGNQIVETQLGDTSAFEDYVYDGPANATTNTAYINQLALNTPQVACTVSEKLLNSLS
jgi:hypothetical protein